MTTYVIQYNKLLSSIRAVINVAIERKIFPSGHAYLAMSSKAKSKLEYLAHMASVEEFESALNAMINDIFASMPKPPSVANETIVSIYGYNISVNDTLAENEFVITVYEPDKVLCK